METFSRGLNIKLPVKMLPRYGKQIRLYVRGQTWFFKNFVCVYTNMGTKPKLVCSPGASVWTVGVGII